MRVLWCWLTMPSTGCLLDYQPILRMRGWLPGRMTSSVSIDFQVASHVRFAGIENMQAGRHVFGSSGCWIDTRVVLTMPDEVMLGLCITIVTGDHTRHGRGFRLGAPRRAPISIGADTWVGTHAVIACGVTIGRGARVAAGAGVTSDVPGDTVVGGAPARVIGPAKDGESRDG